ncbi:protein FAM43B [Tachyglossus aculeatus]|uniref:protein FAM43B n=1 Tax=Tachyglossus aculeatus TaxID=9261 RepID=UPI0018F383BC|nr:protein FAM43B [Tachyglossus aculeatus]
MLPWRRSKFVLVEDEPKCQAKSLRPGLAYGSLLSTVLRACPDLVPGWPLARLGRLFRTRRRKVELTPEDPTYTVCYLGNAVTLQAKGDGCTDDAVAKIWARSGPAGGTKMRLTLGPQGIRMQAGGRPGGRRSTHAYLLPRITYCAADGCHPRVFAWVYRHQARHKAVVLRCHAVLLPKAPQARALAHLLRQAALAAFSDFKRVQRQNDARHVRQDRHCQLLPAGTATPVPHLPLRRLLNSKCPYRPPPAERGRGGAPRLSCILEEDEDQEEDGGDGGQGGDGQRDQGDGRPLQERPEVLSLARELRTCTLRGPPDPRPWKSGLLRRACLAR